MESEQARAWVFFYGTFMSARVLRGHGIDCKETIPASLTGYRLEISSRANLSPDSTAVAYGGLALLPQSDIDALYSALKEDSALSYGAQAVVARTLEGEDQPACCYFCDEMEPGDVDPSYIDQMTACCEELGLPEDYVAHVRSFGR